MILSGKEIKNKVGKEINIDPFDEKRLNPNSYNLRLHDELMVYNASILDMKKPNSASKILIPEEGLLLIPNKLYLGRTIEHTSTDKYVPMIEGRSSIGRLGIFVHVTAGFGDVGFNGYWTLEMFCVHPVKIYAGVDICQIYYHSIEGEYDKYNSGKYQNNDDIQPSLLYKDFGVIESKNKCKIGDHITASVLRPFDGKIVTIHGEITDVSEHQFRVRYNSCRYMDFLMSDIGDTVTINSGKLPSIKTKEFKK